MADSTGAGPSRLANPTSPILLLTSRLAPPSILGSASWEHQVASEDPTGVRLAQLHRWVRVRAPALLEELRRETERSGESIPDEVRKQVIVAATRFTACEAWSCAKSRSTAREILQRPSLRPTVPLVRSLLLSVLRPLFASSSTSTNRSKPTLDPSTSRVLPPRKGLSVAYDHPDMADEVAWKGGSLGSRTEVHDGEGEDAVGSSAFAEGMLSLRSPALGSPQLVWWCCSAAARLASEVVHGEMTGERGAKEETSQGAARDITPSSADKGREDGPKPPELNGLPPLPFKTPPSLSAHDKPTPLEVWDALLPPLVPPLLALLEDPDPTHRTTGAQALSSLLFHSHNAANGGPTHASPAPSLERMRLTPLLLSHCLASFAFLTHERGVRLLDASLGAARRLLLASTAEGRIAEADQERRARLMTRHEGISAVLEEGVFHAWTYRVSLPTSTPLQNVVGSDEDEASEPGDAVLVSLAHLPDLLVDLGRPSARYISLVLEFLSGNLARLTFDVSPRREASRAVALAGTMGSVVRFWGGLGEEGERPPGLAKWGARCVASLAKCWARVEDVGTSKQGAWDLADVEKVRGALQGALRAYVGVDDGVRELSRQLVYMDRRLFADLVGSLEA